MERFIEALQGVEHTRRLGGISGPIEELGPMSLLQMFTATAPRGTLVLRCDQEEGLICFDGGLLRLARLGSATGMKALVRMLSWKDGVFEFNARVDEAPGSEAPFPLEAAAASTRCATSTRAPPSRRVASPCRPLSPATRGATRAPSTASSARWSRRVLDLAAAGFTVQRALEVIPEPDSGDLPGPPIARRRAG